VKISVILSRTNQKKTIDIEEHTSIQEVLKKLLIKSDTCLTLLNNKPVPIDTELEKDQTITLIEVTSGG
jgi:sulfur carrier protein ThiS